MRLTEASHVIWLAIVSARYTVKVAYILAGAVRLRGEGKDARIVTQETKYTPQKTPLSVAAGMLGVPSVPLRAFLQMEGIT